MGDATHVIEPPAGLKYLTEAIAEQRMVVIAYDGGARGPAAHLRITPRAMLQSNGRQYLIAYCHAAEIEKTYRLDRILEVRAASVVT